MAGGVGPFQFIWDGKHPSFKSPRSHCPEAQQIEPSPLRLRILLVYLSPSPFVLIDREILRRHFDVLEFRWSAYRHPARSFLISTVRNLPYDLTFAWFGDAHASFATRVARVLRKPSVIVVGGYDVSDLPGYGYLSTPEGLRQAHRHFRQATCVLPVSPTLEGELLRRFPEAVGKTMVLPTGVNGERFRPAGSREGRVLTVASVTTQARAWVKGLDRVVQVARLLPDLHFTLIGPAPEIVRRLAAPSNVLTKPSLPQDELIPEYQGASVILQPSRFEGLPNVVMEAMACGCVPVVTRAGGMPDLVGDAGFVAGDAPQEVADSVVRALNSPDKGGEARSRALQHFSISEREKRLVATLKGLAASGAFRA